MHLSKLICQRKSNNTIYQYTINTIYKNAIKHSNQKVLYRIRKDQIYIKVIVVNCYKVYTNSEYNFKLYKESTNLLRTTKILAKKE